MKCNGGGNGASGSPNSISESISESESSEKMRDEDVDGDEEAPPVLSLASSYYIYNSVNSCNSVYGKKMSNICLTLYLLG